MQSLPKQESRKANSPKTPGGISKSLLTPIRRLGLSRNWRKSGPSPFRSPLAGSPVVNDESPTTQHALKKKGPLNEINETISQENSGLVIADESDCLPATEPEPIVATPTKSLSHPRKKKPKVEKSVIAEVKCNSDKPEKLCNVDIVSTQQKQKDDDDGVIEEYVEVSTPVRTKSRIPRTRINRKNKDDNKKSAKVLVQVHQESPKNDLFIDNIKSQNVDPNIVITIPKTIIERSPNDLTKECVVVIQKKLFKNELKKVENDKNTQVLFDSDSDEVPLSHLNKEATSVVISDDDDFEEPKQKVLKLEDKHTSMTGLKPTSKTKQNPKSSSKTQPQLKQMLKKIDSNVQTSQGSLSFDDDDSDFDNKRTILIRKTYDKLPKLSKAKSTGSITQKDIDELAARIEMKKKLLMAKGINKDTEELRNLIKKWQKGCQDALMELMDLMKMKFPDKHNMDYSEILETLKIPAALVGYDSDNDCFVTPTDENVVFSKLDSL